jgi:hypothetical protein
VRPTLRDLCTSISSVSADPDQFTSIPFKAKALKILLKELEQSTEPSAIEAPIEDDDAEVWRDSVVRASPR